MMHKATLIAMAALLLASCGRKPDACFTIEKGQPSSKVNEEVEVNAGCSTDAGQFVWDFGDGFSTTGIKAKHKYSVVGQYTIKLTAKNSDREATASKSVTIVP